MIHFGRAALLAIAALLLCALEARAEPRIALVIGNGQYSAVASLDNPVADATLMADTLALVGFDVTLLTNAEQGDLVRGISTFGRALRDAGDDAVGLFYYAGHGVQAFGANYLLPVDAELSDAADIALVGVRAEAVLRQMYSANNRTNVVILDACRDNPFVSIPDMDDNGLAEMKAPTGTFLAYSTAPGRVAVDGLERNSPFTGALALEIPSPGLAIEQVFKRVRNRVLEKTGGLQTPWDTSSLTANFQFVPAPSESAEEVAVRQLWQSVELSRDPVQILLFLRAHPDSRYTADARALLSELVAGEIEPPATAEAAAPAAPQEQAAPAPVEPEPSERELIETARQSGAAADYQAYLDSYPDGVYAELARFELEIIASKQASTDPISQPAPQPAPELQASAADLQNVPNSVRFDQPLGAGGAEIAGKSLADLILGSPLFPPIEGLPDEVWKGKHCSDCHQWTREALCTQARTYLGENATRALSKQHPYGGVFKSSLKVWAGSDCP